MKLRNLLLLDCDGVLTPKKTFYTKEGKALKVFSSDDSYAIKYFHNLDFEILILTADQDGLLVTEKRGSDWKVNVIFNKDKLSELLHLKSKTKFKKIFYVGNGPEDIPVLDEVDLFFAPRDSRPEVLNIKSNKIIILKKDGGEGVLDEVFNYLNEYIKQ